ncbi:hypothetical protein D9758_017702 [Tetrapyrgos nigripes]|uniref:Uncharacterized protein n=1 Tax=Tetrapyrgos nigripes TaxID=182062 RepID=A0A8H5C8R2_9AGAR|nr:hypothetical protein D9758_017702 [Tetrapyrgos nigripes]
MSLDSSHPSPSIITTTIRKCRAKAWDREIAEAAREGRATGTEGVPREYLDGGGPYGYGGGWGYGGGGVYAYEPGYGGAGAGIGGYGGGGGASGGGSGGGLGGYGHEAGSHKAYRVCRQPPMDGRGKEIYQMRDIDGGGVFVLALALALVLGWVGFGIWHLLFTWFACIRFFLTLALAPTLA